MTDKQMSSEERELERSISPSEENKKSLMQIGRSFQTSTI